MTDRKAPPFGVPVGEFSPHEDPITGVHEGDDLRALRAKRPTAERLDRLELKHDALADKVFEIAVSTAPLPQFMSDMREAQRQNVARETVKYTATVEVDTAQKLDTIKSKADKRAIALKIIGGVIALLTSGWLGSHL